MKRCTRCVMSDESDLTIHFNADGVCNYCTEAFSYGKNAYFPGSEGEILLKKKLEEIKEVGKGKKYDCIMGVSGGLDSSYLLYLGKKWGLRVLAIHIDDGFDTEVSKDNIRKLIEATGFDYEVIVPDKHQYCELTKAYMRAGVPNIAIPQDNVLFAFLHDCARKYKIKYFLSGGNFALECVLQKGNSYKARDVVNIKDINKKFGKGSVNKLKFISTFQYEFDKRIYNIKTERLLNYIEYNKDKAFQELKDFCGFEYYGAKHLENYLTSFIQLYWFPKKFGVDKRTSHLSSMIVSGQITRAEALKELEKPLYNEEYMNRVIEIVKKELVLSDDEFVEMMNIETHQHNEYKCEDDTILFKVLKNLKNMLK